MPGKPRVNWNHGSARPSSRQRSNWPRPRRMLKRWPNPSGRRQGVLPDVTEDVRGIGKLLESNQAFKAFTQAVTIADEEQAAALDKIFSGRVHTLTLNALKSMARRGRLIFMRGLMEGFEEIL